MQIVFFGSDDFALTHLQRLIESGLSVAACVTQPDRPKGRGMKMGFSPIKAFALERGIDVLQPMDLKDPRLISRLKSYNSDLFVVVAYGKILPIEVLSIPYLCCMNVHGSLLPKYRGAAPINWAILNGDHETGATIIKMNSAMDAGDIFARTVMAIKEDDTSETLRSRMADQAADLLVKTIGSLEKNDYTLTGQDRTQVSFAPKLNKELGLIRWDQPARTIYNQARGLLPWPGAYTFFLGKTFKILHTQILPPTVSPNQNSNPNVPPNSPGEILEINSDGFIVATADTPLLVRQVHLESSKQMDARSFAVGHKLALGFKFL